MLCDLQCRSRAPREELTTTTTPLSPPSTSPSSSNWATLILSLSMLQLQITCKTLLLALWSLSPSRMERWMQASMHRLTSRSTTSSTTTPLLWRSMALAQRNAATRRRAPQGALAALQRSSVDDGRRVGSTGGGLARLCSGPERRALEEQQGRKVRRDEKTAEENGGR